jgi:hypothetical protein
MALAPTLKRKPGLFGATVPYGTPGIGDGRSNDGVPMAAALPQAAPAKPSFFGDGGVGRAIAGNIGDFLLQYSGMNPIYQPVMQQRQAQAQAEQQHQRRRLDDWADWQQKQEWERNNPKPRNPTTFEQILDAAGIQGEERVGLLRRKAENDAAGVPVGIDVQNPDGSVTRQYVRPGTLGGGMAPPQAPVGKLKPYGGQPVAPAGNFR